MIVDLDEETDSDAGGKAARSEDDEAFLKKLKRWESQARQHWSAWREEAKLAYDFVAGHQWSSDDKTALLDQMRQPVTFNRIAPMVDAVTGAEILNRQEVRYLPREIGDAAVNELITAADEWARELADTEDEESDCFADTVTCGMGWTETRMDYSEDPEGRIIDDRVDPFEMWSDPQARKRNVVDRRYHLRARWRDRDDLPKEWRKKLPESTDFGKAVDDIQTGETGPRDDYERDDYPNVKERGDAKRRRVWIRHFQWWEMEDAWRVADPTQGAVVTMTRDEVKRVGEMFLAQGKRPPRAVKIQQKRYYEAFVAGDMILEKKPIEAQAFTFHCITGKRDRNANTFYGVVRAMIDPQMWGNKFFVQVMHIVNTAAKGGLMYETGAFVNPRKALEDWGRPDAGIELSPNALTQGRVQEREARVYPQGLDRLMQLAWDSLPQISGINLEMLGLVERDQPGVLEAQRKKAGYAILAVFFDSLRRYRKVKGRLRLFYIQNYISDGRLVRIKGQDGTLRYVPLLRQSDTATYDVIVDEAPMSPNQKEATWQMLQTMMPMLAKLDVPPEVWGILLEYSPLPTSVSGKINQIITKAQQQAAQNPPPPDPAVIKAQAQMQTMQAKAQIDQQRSQIDMARDAQDLAHQREMHAMEAEARAAELEATVIEAQIDQETAREKAALEMAAARQRAASANKPKTARKAA